MKKRVSIQTQRRDNDDEEFSCLYYQAKLERPTFACAYETNLLSKVFPSGKTTLGSTFLYSKRVPTTRVSEKTICWKRVVSWRVDAAYDIELNEEKRQSKVYIIMYVLRKHIGRMR